MKNPICYVLEDIQERGMYMSGSEGYMMFATPEEAETYLWTKDCLTVMEFRVELYWPAEKTA